LTALQIEEIRLGGALLAGLFDLPLDMSQPVGEFLLEGADLGGMALTGGAELLELAGGTAGRLGRIAAKRFQAALRAVTLPADRAQEPDKVLAVGVDLPDHRTELTVLLGLEADEVFGGHLAGLQACDIGLRFPPGAVDLFDPLLKISALVGDGLQ